VSLFLFQVLRVLLKQYFNALVFTPDCTDVNKACQQLYKKQLPTDG